MNYTSHLVKCFVAIALSCISLSISAQDKSSSPYFMIISDEETAAQLPLKSTDVKVNIVGVMADVNVKQTYTNTGKTPIEAIYVFPASTRAAVYGMVMKVGERTITAQIEEKHKARNMYATAKQQGKTASLLEEERPNVFKMNVANILPGATVAVNMSYTELLIPTDKIYEFVYPTVVGPRYVSHDEIQSKTNETWNGNPYLLDQVNPTSTLDLKINLNTGIPIKNIRCTTHKNKVNYTNKTQATLTLDEIQGGNRDVVTQYKLAGNQIETGVLLYENPDGENFFLAMMQPPERVEPVAIPAREYIFIVDVSGSMRGFPLNISKQLMLNLFSNLKETDLFNIVFFAGDSYYYAEKSLPVNEANINEAMTFINDASGGGGTELLCALKAAITLNTVDNYARSFVILTDGYVTVEKETFDYIRENIGNANFFSFGIGSSINRYIIEGMAHVGYGEPFIALNAKEADVQAKKLEQYISQPVLTNIKYNFNDFEAYDVLPKEVPDLFANRPIIISGKYRGNANGQLIIEGITGENTISQTISFAKSNTQTQALKYLWAREKIRLLSDYTSLGSDSWSRKTDNKKELEAEITQLGLTYNLLTEYTSFIAIDSIVSNTTGKQITLTQPLPSPQGVSNSAIGNTKPSTMLRAAPPQMSQQLSIVNDNIELSEELELDDMEMDEDLEVEIFDYEEEMEEDDNQVFMIVEKMPQFPGGDTALMNFLRSIVQYPAEAQANNIQGRVYVEFIVDSCGAITDVKILRGVHPLLDAEAIRVIQAMPKWIPGTQRGVKVNVSYRLPINFGVSQPTRRSRPSYHNTHDPNEEHHFQVPPC